MIASIGLLCLTSCGDSEGVSTGSTPDNPAGPTDCSALRIDELAETGPLSGLGSYFDRQVHVFGVHLVAAASVSDRKLLHAAGVMAQYLDNDEDGSPDDARVVEEMTRANALLVMFGTEEELEASGIFEDASVRDFQIQDLYASETHPDGSSAETGFDASLEEVLHLISSAGWSAAYPEAFGEESGSRLTDAMDTARGGRFTSLPPSYPAAAWYHYDDPSCDYRCMATEYFYWSLTSILGAQDYPGRCEEIADEWELCSAQRVESGDEMVHRLLTDPSIALPNQVPDGNYCTEGASS